ncbi:MAG: DegT/DnrJ/EryC1/StrS family aminotransferase [Bacteroidetes bacterium]|nr:DegT/DnrJ/EryC1/StrS family aminotransferase [Bacteroidota bacterium]
MIGNKIFVTKPFLPEVDTYKAYIDKIWASNQLTNNGPLVQKLEIKLKEILKVKHLYFVSNGTIALQMAIKALELTGEIITTPLSFVASTSSLVWQGCTPIFADINRNTLNMEPTLIEKKITKKTTGILTTHLFGIPNDIKALTKIGKKYNIKIIYDAAHSFGVTYLNKSLVSFGDISTLSFHATKLFHTGEGGALITNDDKLAKKIEYIREFGYLKTNEYKIHGLGINGKNSEFHAALGLSILPHLESIIEERKNITYIYNELLSELNITKPIMPNFTLYNYHYYPIILNSEGTLLKIINSLEKKDIYPKRYFYPSLNNLNYIKQQKLEIANDVSRRMLCLPLYVGLSTSKVKQICQIIANNL